MLEHLDIEKLEIPQVVEVLTVKQEPEMQQIEIFTQPERLPHTPETTSQTTEMEPCAPEGALLTTITAPPEEQQKLVKITEISLHEPIFYYNPNFLNCIRIVHTMFHSLQGILE